MELIEASIEILEEIQPASVRAVCYRLFTLGLIDCMSKNNTNKVGRQLVDAREAGSIPWAWIVDESRERQGVPTWDDPKDFGRTITTSYRKNKWAGQPVRIECWSEKSTVKGMLMPVLGDYEVDFVSVHGYSSATAVQNLVTERLRSPKPLLLLYVGDWDPSGLHMSEIDLPARAEDYSRREWLRRTSGDFAPLDIRRIALTEDDVTDSDLPSFAAATKTGDPRYRWFVDHYGPRCWELDALSPVLLRDRVKAAIHAELDVPTWNRYVEAERVELDSITRAVSAWRELVVAP